MTRDMTMLIHILERCDTFMAGSAHPKGNPYHRTIQWLNPRWIDTAISWAGTVQALRRLAVVGAERHKFWSGYTIVRRSISVTRSGGICILCALPKNGPATLSRAVVPAGPVAPRRGFEDTSPILWSCFNRRAIPPLT